MGTETKTRFGLGGTAGWVIGGVLGGAIAAAAFGAIMLLVEPAAITSAIPEFYGFEPSAALGLAIHLVHGAVLGLVFGFVVTRPAVLGVLRTNVETEAVSGTGLIARVVIAGFVFGLAVWAVLPLAVLPLVVGTLGAGSAEVFSAVAVETMVAHFVFGLVLGLVFALTVDLSERPISDVFTT